MEEVLTDKSRQRLLALVWGEIPESLRLGDRQTQAWHLEVFRSHAVDHFFHGFHTTGISAPRAPRFIDELGGDSYDAYTIFV